jgi:hypothetical protein
VLVGNRLGFANINQGLPISTW